MAHGEILTEKLDYDIVGVNDVFPASPDAPFGGIKQSGNGKEGGHHGMPDRKSVV